MIFPKKLVTFYKQNNPSDFCSAWVNYNEEGCLVNITNFHGEILNLLSDGTILLNKNIWIPKNNL